jgi:hypothetical protein
MVMRLENRRRNKFHDLVKELMPRLRSLYISNGNFIA